MGGYFPCVCVCVFNTGREEGFVSKLQLHTYMNDVWIGVPVIGADKKVDQELSSIFLIQLGDDILQPPCFTWVTEKEGKVRKGELTVHNIGCVWHCKKITLP